MRGTDGASSGAVDSRGKSGFVKDVVRITVHQQIPGFAQMVAYNLLFATAPFLMVMTAGAAAITRTVNQDLQNPAQPVLDWLQNALPQETAAFLEQPIEDAVNADINWLFSVGALLALWGARGAVAAIIRGLNMAYGIGKDPRPFLVHTARSLGLTLLIVVLVSLAGIVYTLGTDIGNRIAEWVGLTDLWSTISWFVRWPLIMVLSVGAVMTLHWFGPAVKGPLKWYLPGSTVSVAGVYLVTLALGVWLDQSTTFSETYGVFGSVLAFILWLFLIAFVLLLGVLSTLLCIDAPRLLSLPRRTNTMKSFHMKQFGAYLRTHRSGGDRLAVGCCLTGGDLRYLAQHEVSSHAKRWHPPTRSISEGERLTDWQLWNSRGNGHLFGHLELAGDTTC